MHDVLLNTCKNVLKRGLLIELAATMRQVSLVILFAVFYLFFVKDAGDFFSYYTVSDRYLLCYNQLWDKNSLETACIAESAAWKKEFYRDIDRLANLPQVREDIQHHSYELFQIRGIAVIDVNEKKTLPEKLGTSHLWQRANRSWITCAMHGWMKYLSICSQMIRG